jgi:hypothetical protein
MQRNSEIRVTLSDELLDVLQAQARALRVPLRWVIASLVCDTIETATHEPGLMMTASRA